MLGVLEDCEAGQGFLESCELRNLPKHANFKLSLDREHVNFTGL